MLSVVSEAPLVDKLSFDALLPDGRPRADGALARLPHVLAGAQVAVLFVGWGVAQHPYLIAPDLTIAGSAAPKATLALTAMTLPIGAGVLIPSLWYLFAVFKGRNPEIKNPDSP